MLVALFINPTCYLSTPSIFLASHLINNPLSFVESRKITCPIRTLRASGGQSLFPFANSQIWATVRIYNNRSNGG